MPPIVLNEPGVRIVQESNSLTIGDSVKIVVSGLPPTCVKVSKTVPTLDNSDLEIKMKQGRSRISKSPMDMGGKLIPFAPIAPVFPILSTQQIPHNLLLPSRGKEKENKRRSSGGEQTKRWENEDDVKNKIKEQSHRINGGPTRFQEGPKGIQTGSQRLKWVICNASLENV